MQLSTAREGHLGSLYGTLNIGIPFAGRILKVRFRHANDSEQFRQIESYCGVPYALQNLIGLLSISWWVRQHLFYGCKEVRASGADTDADWLRRLRKSSIPGTRVRRQLRNSACQGSDFTPQRIQLLQEELVGWLFLHVHSLVLKCDSNRVHGSSKKVVHFIMVCVA